METKIFFIVDYGDEERREFSEEEKENALIFFKRKRESSKLPVAIFREIRISQFETLDHNFEWFSQNKERKTS